MHCEPCGHAFHSDYAKCAYACAHCPEDHVGPQDHGGDQAASSLPDGAPSSQDHGGDQVASSPNEVAATLIAKHSEGNVRMSLEPLSVGPFNRVMSPKYCHYRLDNIIHTDGFGRMRYKNAIAIEPNPADPLAGARRTNKEADMSSGMLPMCR